MINGLLYVTPRRELHTNQNFGETSVFMTVLWRWCYHVPQKNLV